MIRKVFQFSFIFFTKSFFVYFDFSFDRLIFIKLSFKEESSSFQSASTFCFILVPLSIKTCSIWMTCFAFSMSFVSVYCSSVDRSISISNLINILFNMLDLFLIIFCCLFLRYFNNSPFSIFISQGRQVTCILIFKIMRRLTKGIVSHAAIAILCIFSLWVNGSLIQSYF